MASSSADAPCDLFSHGEDFDEFVDILYQLMQYLKRRRLPIFWGRMTQILHWESWTMEVFLYAREGEFISHTFKAEQPKSRSIDTVQNVVRFTVTRLFQMDEDLLLRSPFYFYLTLQEGEQYPETFDVRVNDSCLTHQVQLTQALSAALADVVDEIGQLRSSATTLTPTPSVTSSSGVR